MLTGAVARRLCPPHGRSALAFDGQFLAANAGFDLTENPAVLDLAHAVLHRRLEG
ncbi:hypothetical protein DFO66_104251 [Brevibacterium sanguinis]|uniref:Uncharacterized protein n=2 Tax=Brevibacterium TaxID=1696 RepID=A0A366IJL1_9MICO|nr:MULTISPECIES: hypothetical protein [Brevibacterium]RBP65665.1 hypothetical protein DFO66_104251 [Brevibacterium sanguinis]RBP72299.1 hypothetical protein DFO65_104257 [Brevibacterium celere]